MTPMEENMSEEIRVTYHICPQTISVERAKELLLAEMTSGIAYISELNGVWMDPVANHVPFVHDSIKGSVLNLTQRDDDSYEVTFSLPATNLDPNIGGLTSLWSVVAGEIFNFFFIKRATLLDLQLPPSFEDYYLGPRFGVAGIRRLLDAEGRPLFGAIIKPNLGLNPEQTAGVVASLGRAGFDFIKDDEITVSPSLCPLEARVANVARAVEQVRQETGHHILYAANVTTDFAAMGCAAETAIKCGAEALMIDPFCTGFSSIDFLRRNFGVPIYVHRVGYGIFTSGPSYSVSYEVFSKIFRLLGADFAHVGGIWGGGGNARIKTQRYLDILRGCANKAATWPVVTGISLESISEYYAFYGDDALYMDHNDLYRDSEVARRKLADLKMRAIHN